MTPDLSIIIVNWNTREMLNRCLQLVFATVSGISFDVWVVDNDSIDGSAEMVEADFPQAKLIRSGGNIGFARGNNLALQKAEGRYIVLLNPDTELHPNAVSIMMAFSEEHPDVAVVGPKLLESDGTLQKNGRLFPSVLRELMGLLRLRHRLARFNDRLEWGRDDFDVTAEVDEVMGSCMFIKRKAIDQVGFLDEKYFMYYEEVDWCFRMKKAGWKIYYLPTAVVTHHHGKASEQIGIEKLRIAFRSMYYYFRKNHGLIPAVFLRVVSWMLLVYADLPWVRRKRARAEKQMAGDR